MYGFLATQHLDMPPWPFYAKKSWKKCGIEIESLRRCDAKITLNTVGIGRKRWRSRTEEGPEWYGARRLLAMTSFPFLVGGGAQREDFTLLGVHAQGVGRHSLSLLTRQPQDKQ